MAESAAGQAAAAVLAERDAIQANLLELDGGFTRRLLDGATLTGQTRERWDAASATLAGLWETYLAYSAVVDRVAELGVGPHRPAKKDLPELDSLLTGARVQLASAAVPLAHRNLSDTGVRTVTLTGAVTAMRRSFSEVAEVTSTVETVWTQVNERLDAAEAELSAGLPRAAGLAMRSRRRCTKRRPACGPRGTRLTPIRLGCGTAAASTPRPRISSGSRWRRS